MKRCGTADGRGISTLMALLVAGVLASYRFDA
jgi:hypothetical protein